MFRSIVAALLGLLLPNLVSAYDSSRFYKARSDEVPGTIQLPLTLVESGSGEGPQYLVNISIGTPPQEVTVQIDTGSSDLWIFANDNVCDNSYGCLGSSFDTNASSTLVNDLPGKFAYSYGSGANGTGDYVTDSITIGGQTIQNARFGVAHASSGISPLYGLMGLGFPSGEFAVTQNLSEYNTTVMTMANQGVINTAAFSLYLNDLESQGNILFGGYDQAKYVGDLQTVDLLNMSDYEQYYVNLTALGVSTVSSSANSSSTTWYSNTTVSGAAFIDCGSPKMYLPADGSINAIYSLGGEYNSDLTYSLIPCSAVNDTTSTVDIQLGPGDAGPLVKIPLSELVEPYLGEDSGNVTVNGEEACSFGLSPGPDGFQVLGDAFIRGVYILFNMEEHTVSMAQAKYDVEERDIVAV